MKWTSAYFPLIALGIATLAYCNPISDVFEVDDSDMYSMPECLDNQVFSQCDANPSCQKTCVNIGTWEASPCLKTKECIAGCICAEGYARNADGNCIKENQCPRVRH